MSSELNSDRDEQELKQTNKWVYIAPLLLFIFMLILLASGLGKDPTKLESQLIGKPIPQFQKKLLLDTNKTMTEKDIQGPALINVFASWCPSCYHEHPELMKLSAAKTVRIYGLNYKDKREAGLKFINDLGDPYDFILFDDNGRLGIDLGVYGAPETFVINDKNEIVYRHVGVVDQNVWLNILKPKMFAESNNQAGGQ